MTNEEIASQEKAAEQRKNNIVETYKKQGLNDYQIERKIDMIFNKPEELLNYESGNDEFFNDVTFYFNDDEFEKFKKVFKVLSYVKNNSNQNWILLGFCKLVEEGKIITDTDKKEVRLNG
jgi:hypothetical protein